MSGRVGDQVSIPIQGDLVVRRALVSAVVSADRALFAAIAGARPILDPVLPRLSRAADHSLLWWGVAATLGASRGRRRRAAARGLIALCVASAAANGPVKIAFRRVRPSTHGVPLVRRLRRDLTTFSFPSGHAASAAAFATGLALDAPGAAVPVGVLAGAVAFSRVYVGVHYPGDVVAGIVIGVVAGLVTTKVLPRRSWRPVRARPASAWAPTLPDGEGLTIVVNETSGLGHRGVNRHADLLRVLRAELPCAKVVEVGTRDDLVAALLAAAADARVLGVAGGDGTINAAVGVAVAHGMPLAVFPAGTLNHFAADVGLAGAGDGARAVRAGTAVAVDVGRLRAVGGGGRRFDGFFVNTASLGSYPDVVAVRERFERRFGKWPAMMLALIWVLHHESPIDVEIDGRRRRLWLVFIGNGIYHPDGFAPTYRNRLDEGLLDLRLLDGAAPLARCRLVAAVLTGRLGRSRVYRQQPVERVHVVAATEQPLPFARDGEVAEGVRQLTATTSSARLIVYRPAGSTGSSLRPRVGPAAG
jgi:undecaprenyl-diphosphatase